MKTTRTLQLTEELIALDSITPQDKGCQQKLQALLAPLGFNCETIESNGVTNATWEPSNIIDGPRLEK